MGLKKIPNYFINNLKRNFNPDRKIEIIDIKLAWLNIFIMLFLVFSYSQVYKLSNEINNEISFRNYLEGINKNQFNPNYNPILNIEKEKLKFPFHYKIILAITFGLILINIEYAYILRRKTRKLNELNNKPNKPLSVTTL